MPTARCARSVANRTPELFWALRGGGGDFRVVISFTSRLHPISRELEFAVPVCALAGASISPPTGPAAAWQMDEFLDVVEKVTRRDGAGRVSVRGMVQMSKCRLYSDDRFVRSNGADRNSPCFRTLNAAEKTVSGYLDHPDSLAALKLWQDLHQVHAVMPTAQTPDMFATGLAAFYQPRTSPWAD